MSHARSTCSSRLAFSESQNAVMATTKKDKKTGPIPGHTHAGPLVGPHITNHILREYPR